MSVLIKTFFHLRQRCSRRSLLRLCVAQSHVSSSSEASRQRRRISSALPVEKTQDSEERPVYVDTWEVRYMHSLLEKSVFYKETLATLPTAMQIVNNADAELILNLDWTTLNDTDKLNAFRKLSHHYIKNNQPFPAKRYECVLQSLAQSVPNFEYEELVKLMRCMVPFAGHFLNYTPYVKLLRSIDQRYIGMYTKLSVKQLLLTADLFYKLQLRYTKAMRYTLRRLGGKPHRLTAKNLIQLLFYLSVCGKGDVNMYEMEYHLGECLNEVSINELGIALRAFFKNSTQIKSKELIDNIMQKTIQDIKNVDSIHLAAIMKNLRYSAKPMAHKDCLDLLHTITPETSRLSLMCLTHIAQFATKQFTYHKNLMEQVLKRFCQEVSVCRVKDWERILLSMIMTCPDSVTEHAVQKLVEELIATHKTSRLSEIELYPASFMRIMLYLSYRNIYVHELIEHTFDPTFLKILCKKNSLDLWREITTLETNVKLEFPAYTGPWIKNGIRDAGLSVTLLEHEKNPGKNQIRLLLSDIAARCEQLYNHLPYIGHVLPHYATQNVILAFDRDKKPVPVSHILSQIPNREFKYVNTEEHKHLKWIAICPIPNSQVVVGTNAYTYLTRAKMRQLELIGYTPIAIQKNTWVPMHSTLERNEYFKRAIKNALASKGNVK